MIRKTRGGRMGYCSKCGNELREGAAYCDRCGTSAISPSYADNSNLRGGDIYRSAGLIVSQQRLILSMMFGGMGVLFLVMSAVVQPMPGMFGQPSDSTFNTITLAMGLVLILIGIGIFVLGRSVQRGDSKR